MGSLDSCKSIDYIWPLSTRSHANTHQWLNYWFDTGGIRVRFYGNLSAAAGVLYGIGAIYTLVPFVAGAMIQAGMPWYLAACSGIVTGVGISLLCEWLNPKEFALRGGRMR